jgi:hypothetical protein
MCSRSRRSFPKGTDIRTFESEKPSLKSIQSRAHFQMNLKATNDRNLLRSPQIVLELLSVEEVKCHVQLFENTEIKANDLNLRNKSSLFTKSSSGVTKQLNVLDLKTMHLSLKHCVVARYISKVTFKLPKVGKRFPWKPISLEVRLVYF